jgi:hypothetical protein
VRGFAGGIGRCALAKMLNRVVSTDSQIDAAIARGRLHAGPRVVIAGPGTGSYWPQRDVSHYVRSLMDGVLLDLT